MKTSILIILLIANQAFAQSSKETELKTTISNVTVYLSGAQITRHGEVTIESGRSKVIVKSLSPLLDAKSIQVKANGAFSILSVNRTINYLNELKLGSKTDSITQRIKQLDLQISKKNSRLEVLAEMQSLLNINKKLGSESSGSSILELKQAIDFYNTELTEIKSEELMIQNQLADLTNEIDKLKRQIADLKTNQNKPTCEIEINVDAPAKTTGKFALSYLVANAGWYPKYDLRVKDVQNPLELTYKAEVYQQTGVDWNNVKLTFSNANPNQSGVAPELTTWYLNFHRNTIYNRTAYGLNAASVSSVSGKLMGENNQPLPGANVVVTGTSIGTVTDIEGNYSLTLPNNASHITFSYIGYTSQEVPITSPNMNVALIPDITQLNEVVVTGYGSSRPGRSLNKKELEYELASTPVVSTVVENQTTVEFEVDLPYTIKSNGENLIVNLKSHEIETIYEYYAVPKLDKDAFLMARIINWDQFNLLEGEANLYFENTYVGRSILNAKALTDTLDISLGRDKNIVIGREKMDTFTKKMTLASNKLETRAFKITVRNKKSLPIHLTIFDQIPVSAISEIEVSSKELTKGLLNEQSGIVTWTMDLEAQKQTELKMEYEVKYPKREALVLE